MSVDQQNISDVSNPVAEWEGKKPEELQTLLSDKVKEGKYEDVKHILAELEKSNPDFEMNDAEGKSLSDRFKVLVDSYKNQTLGKERVKKFFEEDIKANITETKESVASINEWKNTIMSTLLDALNDKDATIKELTKEKDDALNTLPKVGEIIWQGRRMNKLFENIKDLEEHHKDSYPENALRLLMVQSTYQHLGIRKLGAKMKMGFGKDISGFGKRLLRLHKADIHEHLQAIIDKVDDQEKNGKGEWTKFQAKRLKTKIIEVQNAYVNKEKDKIGWYVFGERTNNIAA